MICDIHTHTANPRCPSLVDISGGGDSHCGGGGGIFFSMGVHPMQAGHPGADAMICRIEEAAASGRIQAVGECGLDKYSPCPRGLASAVFLRQAAIASRHGLPLIVHCVRLYSEIVSAINKIRFQPPVVLHSYNGNPETTAMLLRLPNVYFSFGLLRCGTGLRSLGKIPLGRVLLESDDIQEPDYAGALGAMASLAGVDARSMEDAIYANFRAVLGLG